MPEDIWLTFPDGSEHELRQSVTIGRDPTNDLTFTSNTVSREHAGITLRDGRWYLEDRGSYNGTFLNGTPGGTGTVKAALRRIYAKAGLSDEPAHAKRRALCRVARQRGWV